MATILHAKQQDLGGKSAEMGKRSCRRPDFGSAELWLAALLLCIGMVTEAGARQTILVLSEQGTHNLEAGVAIHREMEGNESELAVHALGVDEIHDRCADTVLVPLGVRATEAVAGLAGAASALAGLLPCQQFEKILREVGPQARREQFSAVYLDQSDQRQFQLLNASLPDAHPIGIGLGSTTQGELEKLWEAAGSGGLRLVAENVHSSSTLFLDMGGPSDVLLLPDVEIVNRVNLQNLILTTCRQGRPVIGYSSVLAGAGARLAVYSTPARIGRLLAEITKRRPFVLPPPQAPRYFNVPVNREVVARAPAFIIPSDAQLLSALHMEAPL